MVRTNTTVKLMMIIRDVTRRVIKGIHDVVSHYSYRTLCICVLIFFFQAEDGIRDLTVTGVQTCALPIFCRCLSCRHARVKAAHRATPRPTHVSHCKWSAFRPAMRPVWSSAPPTAQRIPKDRKSVV